MGRAGEAYEIQAGEKFLPVGGRFKMKGRDGVERVYVLCSANALTCSIAIEGVDMIPRAGVHTASVIRALESGDAMPVETQ